MQPAIPATPPSEPPPSTDLSSGQPKPRLRGVTHEAAAFAMLAIGPLVVLRARSVTAEALSAVYVATITAMLSASALLHRINWSPLARRRMRRLDHSMIFFAIAGSYTAAAGLVLPGTDAPVVIGVVWVGALGGVAFRLAFLDAPKWIVALPYVVLGWLAVAVIPEIFHAVGGLGIGLLIGGGLLYTAGAVVYARRRPDPWPAVFGYHEIFHALVVCAVAMHLCLVAFVELPRFAT